MQASEFAALLHAKQLRRGHWLASCPAHPDKHPSLSIAEGRKHPVVFKCMSAGCTQDEVLRAMGLTWNDLLGERPSMSREARGRLADEQMLYALLELRRVWAVVGYYYAPRKLVNFAGIDGWMRPCDIPALKVLDKRILAIQYRLDPKLKVIHEQAAKTARFVEQWGWDKLWEIYFDKTQAES